MKKLILSLSVLLATITVTSQTKNLGTPISFGPKVKLTKECIKLPYVNNKEQQAFYEAKSKQTGEKNLKYGFTHEVNINVFEQAYKQTLPNGSQLYQLMLESENAISLNVIFSQFRLAEGTVLYLFSADKSAYIGAYTSLNNNNSNELGTELLYTNKIVIEVMEPKNNQNKSSLVISRVIHGFIHLDQTFDKDLNDAGDCNIDVNCPEGEGWEAQRNSVALLVDNNGGFCSGAMVNNTSGSLIPYFLTANHCGSSPGSWVFRFRWEAPADQTNCGTVANSGNGPENMNINGGVTKASYAPSDFHLIELNNLPDPAWGVRFSGWDKTGIPPLSGAGIHHPSGDIKKISLSNESYQSVPYSGSVNDHWHVQWSDGVTEGGSSGSPIFDQEGRIVGQLHGGASFCGGNDLSDLYGMFSESWEGGGTPSSRLKDWLDPSSTDLGFIDANILSNLDASLANKILGLDKINCTSVITPQVILTNGGNSILTSATINYTIDGVTNSLTWSGNLNPYGSDTIIIPTQTFSSGTHNLEVEVINPNNMLDEVIANNLTSSSFNVITNGEIINVGLYFDCYASETSWDIKDLNGNIIYAGDNYSDNNFEAYNTSQKVCLSETCFTFNIYDSYGDGMLANSCPDIGNVILTSETADTIYVLQNPGFGSSSSESFCVANFSGVDETTLVDLVIYPNPFENTFVIESNSIIKEIVIIDALGKIVEKISVSENSSKKELDINLSKGIYTIQLTTISGIVNKKLIKS